MPGSPNFAHAVVVDPNGTNANADFTSINQAIQAARGKRPTNGPASGSGNTWQIQTSGLTVDVNHATVNPGTISTGDSFEFTYLTAR